MTAEAASYATQSRITDPGRFADWAAGVPGDLSAIRRAARQLVFHYRAGGGYAENGIEPGRVTEIDTRYAERMLARLAELADQPLVRDRAPRQRIVGCCRDFTVLFLAIARQHGIPARARVGFAGYFEPGWWVDHVVAEVWDAEQRRWRLVDPELGDGHTDPSDGAPVDPEDIPGSKFLPGPQAWQQCRAGTAAAGRFLVDPALDIPATKGWPYLRHNLILDLAALNRHEMLLWDYWGLDGALDEAGADPSPAQLAVLDGAASVTGASGAPQEVIQRLYEDEHFRVPDVVTSYSPAASGPLRIAVAV
jgi:Transglutaminase-like superfamily